MERTFKNIIESYLLNTKKLSFTLDELEEHVVKQNKNMNNFIDKGGINQLKKDILIFQDEKKIVPMKKKIINPTFMLPNHWKKVKKDIKGEWSRSYVLSKMSNMDLTYFINNPENQTDNNKEIIDKLYTFLESSDLREIVTIEERMYELFRKEKWLQKEPKGENGQLFLSKLKLQIEDLKAKKFPEPIPYETRNRMPLSQVENILITENNSFYHSVRRCMEFQNHIAGIPIDMIVYGRGKQVISNFEYIYTLFENASQKKYLYIGDIDPEGISIFAEVKRKYKDLHIKIAKEIYIWMLKLETSPPNVESNQRKNNDDFNLFISYFNKEEDGWCCDKLKTLWEEGKRIPQEVINYERLIEKGMR